MKLTRIISVKLSLFNIHNNACCLYNQKYRLEIYGFLLRRSEIYQYCWCLTSVCWIYTSILLVYKTKRILWCMHLKHTPGMRKVKIKTNVIGQIRSWKLVYTPTDHLAKDKGISGCFFYFKDYIEIWGVGQVWRSFCLPAHTYLQKGERC